MPLYGLSNSIKIHPKNDSNEFLFHDNFRIGFLMILIPFLGAKSGPSWRHFLTKWPVILDPTEFVVRSWLSWAPLSKKSTFLPSETTVLVPFWVVKRHFLTKWQAKMVWGGKIGQMTVLFNTRSQTASVVFDNSLNLFSRNLARRNARSD